MATFLAPSSPEHKKVTSAHNRSIIFAASSPHPTTVGGAARTVVPPSAPIDQMRRVSGALFKALGASEYEKAEIQVKQDGLLQEKWAAMQHLRLSPSEVQAVVNDPAHFHHIQQALREMGGQTDALAQQVVPALMRERLEECRAAQQQAARLQQEQQRKHEIARELAEARIKARQALQITTTTAEDNDEDPQEEEITSSESPTSVTNMLALSEDQLVAFKPGLDAEVGSTSDDGDIQELEE